MAVEDHSLQEQDKVLRDIEASVGLRCPGIDHIHTSDKHLAELTLPILARWPERIQAPTIRAGIYHRFATSHARRFFPQLLDWWLNEPDSLAASLLTQAITRLVTAAQAPEVWARYRDQPSKPFHYLLLAKLARLKSSVSEEVKDALIHDLRNRTLERQDLLDISKIGDERIQAVLAELNVPVPRTRKAKGQGNTPEVPPGAVVTSKAPDRRRELFSTEDDVENLSGVLREIEERFQFIVPNAEQIAEPLVHLRRGKWLLLPASGNGEDVSLAFYLEDVDTFGVVVYRTDRSPALSEDSRHRY
jgi:hypothetical protein